MKTKKYVGLALLFISLILAITLGINFMLYAKDDHLFSEGITISGIDVGSLTKEQAQEKINQTLENWLAQPLEFQAGGEVITLPLAALNPQVDLEAPLNEAYKIGRKASLFARAQKAATAQDARFELGLTWDEQRLSETLAESLALLNKEPVDATFKISANNLMEVQPDQPGQAVQADALVNQIKELEPFQDPAPLKVELQEVAPALRAADLEAKKIDGLIASH
ncbi:MAG: peptidoglycan binding domain-containing protein, partial [Desulfitobacterium hafniense]